MLRLYSLAILFTLSCLPALGLQRLSGYCSQGGVQGQVQFSTSQVTPKFIGSYPGCTINVYVTGTLTHLTIYSDQSSTPKTNPFAADAKTGYWAFYLDGFANPEVDINMSGAGIATPFTVVMESGVSITGNVSTTGNMVNGNVPKSTGATTLTDGGQVYPTGPFADTNSSQVITNKDLTSTTNLINASQISAIGAIRYATLPTSCVAGTNPAALAISGGIDAIYTCDNTGHYALPPGGSTTVLSGAITGAGGANVIAGGANGLVVSSSSGTLSSAVAAPSGAVVGTTDTQTIQHKTFDSTNTFPALPYDPTGAAAAAQAAAIATAEAFSANGSNITSGTVAAARIANPLNQNTTGNAGTASAFDHSPSGCSLNFAPNGIISVGNFTGCTEIEPCLNIITYGGSGNGSTSNNTAWNAAIAASVPDQVCLYFPPGTYAFASQPSWTAPHTYSSITVRGDAPDVSQLVFPSAIVGPLLQTLANSNSIHVRDLSIRTSGVGNANGLTLRNTGSFGANGGSASDITDVTFYGADCVACTDYWQNALVLDGVSVVSIDRVKVIGQPTGGGTTGLGNAVFIESSNAFPAVVFNINAGSEFDYVNQGVLIGDWIQGITINQTNMTGVTTGVSVPAGETHGLDQLLMTNNQINAGANAINIQSPFNHTGLVNNYFLIPGAVNGVFIINTSTTNVANNFFLNIDGGGGNGVVLSSYNAGLSSVQGNTFEGMTTAIFLQSGSSQVTVGPNTYSGVTNKVVDSGSGNVVPASCPSGITAGTVVIVNGIITHC